MSWKYLEPDDLVVNYHDACMYGRDLLVLRTNDWLNGDCIHYWLKRLQQDCCSSSCDKCRTTLLFDPSAISFFMHQCEDEDEMADFASGYEQFQFTDRLLIPISDDMKPSAHWNIPGQGTHWSLLVLAWEKEAGRQTYCPKGYHYDSIPESGNMDAAYAVATKFYQLLQLMGVIRPSIASLNECPVPRQKNTVDCGIHVLITAETLLQGTCDETQIRGRLTQLFQENPDYCCDYRNRIAEDVLLVAAKYAK